MSLALEVLKLMTNGETLIDKKGMLILLKTKKPIVKIRKSMEDGEITETLRSAIKAIAKT